MNCLSSCSTILNATAPDNDGPEDLPKRQHGVIKQLLAIINNTWNVSIAIGLEHPLAYACQRVEEHT